MTVLAGCVNYLQVTWLAQLSGSAGLSACVRPYVLKSQHSQRDVHNTCNNVCVQLHDFTIICMDKLNKPLNTDDQYNWFI